VIVLDLRLRGIGGFEFDRRVDRRHEPGYLNEGRSRRIQSLPA
jgi:hypothetical protein